MDRQIDKKILKRERISKIAKIAVGICSLAALIVIVSLIFRPGVSLREITLNTVDIGNIDISISTTGKVVPAFEEIINSPVSSRIVEVYKKSGDRVEEGTPILKLDLQSVETDYTKLLDEEQMKILQLEQLRLSNKSNLSEMRMNLNVKKMEVSHKEVEYRNEIYLDSLGSGTTDKVRQAEMAFRIGQMQLSENEQKYENEKALAQANEKVKELELNIFRKGLEEMKRTLEDAQIRSPRSAVLSFVNTEIGSQVSQGSRVAVISDNSHFKIDGEIADSYGDRISIGQSAVIKIGNELHNGIISNVASVASNGVIPFSIQLQDDSNSKLRAGLNCEVYIIDSRKENVMRLANGRYYIGRGDYDLFVMEGGDNTTKTGTLVKRPVKLGGCNFDYVEVLDGLKEGDVVLTSDSGSLGSKSSAKKLKVRE